MYSKKYPTFKRKCNGTEKQNYIHHKNLQTRTQLHPSAKENRLGKLLTFTSLILRTKEKKIKNTASNKTRGGNDKLFNVYFDY